MQQSDALEFNLIGITKAGLKYKKHILIFAIIGLIAGIILAFLITPKYEASAVFYPPANNSISKSVLDNSNLEGLMEFGSEEQTDQMLQILNSDLLKENVIRKFNLMEHYQIEKDSKFALTKTKKQFESNADFKRTDYLAVKISITDTDPAYAADMANYIGLIVDSIKSSIQKERTQQAFQIIKEQYFAKKLQLDSIQKVLTAIRVKGVYDYQAQSEVLSIAIVKAETQVEEEQARLKVYNQYQNKLPDTTIIKAKGRLEAAKAALQVLKPRIETFGKYSGDYLENEALVKSLNSDLANLKIKYENAYADFNHVINQKFMIDRAQKPEIKAYPNRLLVVLIVAFFATLIGLLMAVYQEIVNPRLTKV